MVRTAIIVGIVYIEENVITCFVTKWYLQVEGT